MDQNVFVLSADNVENIFIDCLYNDGEDTSDHILAEGVMLNAGFKPEKIEEHRQEIHNMLADLPDQFKESTGGGGWSFLQACVDKNNRQWTGMHQTMDQLVLLGLAIGEVEYCLPRELWPALPGGMPYFVVKQ